MSEFGQINGTGEDDERKGVGRDKTVCFHFDRTGCCPRGTNGKYCTLKHVPIPFSRCLVFHHLYPNPDYFNEFIKHDKVEINPEKRKAIYEAFYIDVLLEFLQFGKVEDMFIASNLTEHLYGNVYVRFQEVDAAVACHMALEGRFYAGRLVNSTFVPLERLSSTLCLQHMEGKCLHGDVCSLVHKIPLTRTLMLEAFPKVLQVMPEPLIEGLKDMFYDDPNDLVRGVSKYIKPENR